MLPIIQHVNHRFNFEIGSIHLLTARHCFPGALDLGEDVRALGAPAIGLKAMPSSLITPLWTGAVTSATTRRNVHFVLMAHLRTPRTVMVRECPIAEWHSPNFLGNTVTPGANRALRLRASVS